MRLRAVGDLAVLAEVDDLESAHRLRSALLAAGLAGVVEVVPGGRTVLVTTSTRDGAERVRRALPDLVLPPVEQVRSRLVEVPVVYDGQDLDEVAALTGLCADEIVRRHVEGDYVVAFLGFAPGFPYLAGLDPALHVPRRATPRTRVPAGSVGLAGAQTGVYPQELPGGWQLIGRTDVVLFDAERDPPALLAPGDRVRFVRA